MSNKKVFVLVHYKILEKNKLSLNGYVVDTIKLDDMIFTKYRLKKYNYFVKKITAYHREFDCIEKGISAELIVEGVPVGFNLDTVFWKKKD